MSWSKRIRIVFDRKVYNVTPTLKDYFRLIETTYGTYIYPINVTYGANDHEIYLEFNDFYRALQPLTLEYLGGTTFGGKDFEMDAFTLTPIILNCNPSDANEYLALSNIEIDGVIAVGFDGKLYSNEYLQLGSATAAGQYCDINGIPL